MFENFLFSFVSIISKISDNASEGSYHAHQYQPHHGAGHNDSKKQPDKFCHTKNGQMMGTGQGDSFKFDVGRKTQTYHSDVEEGGSNYAQQVQQPQMQLPGLPPIFKKQSKKAGAGMHMTGSQFGGSHASNLTSFNATKKNFPQLNKLTTHKKSYISPYSIKSIPRQA